MTIPKIKDFEAEIVSVKNLTHNVKHFVLELKKPREINFQAGQYVLIKIPGQNVLYRAYSIFSPPQQKHKIELLITIIPEGKASTYFTSAKKGEVLQLKGPLGFMFINKPSPAYVFIATGTGITPFHSMIIDLLQKNSQTKIKLFFGVRNEKDIFLEKILKNLKKQYPNFNYTLTLSQPSAQWQRATGRVTKHIANFSDYQNKKYYLCGSTAMINEVSEILKNKKVDHKNIHFERFY